MVQKEELVEKMISDIMENFDFNKVHNTMIQLNLQWHAGDGKLVVPSSYRLMKEADRLLHIAAKHYGEGEPFYVSTGGFVAIVAEDTLTLQFVLEETSVEKEDYIGNDN